VAQHDVMIYNASGGIKSLSLRPSLVVFYFYFQNWTFENKNKKTPSLSVFFFVFKTVQPDEGQEQF
jgi:hypothetical protein